MKRLFKRTAAAILCLLLAGQAVFSTNFREMASSEAVSFASPAVCFSDQALFLPVVNVLTPMFNGGTVKERKVVAFALAAILVPTVIGAGIGFFWHSLSISHWPSITTLISWATGIGYAAITLLAPSLDHQPLIRIVHAEGVAPRVVLNPAFHDPTLHPDTLENFRKAVEAMVLSADPVFREFFAQPGRVAEYLDEDALADFRAAEVHQAFENSPWSGQDYLGQYVRWVMGYSLGHLSLEELAAPVGYGLGSRKFFRQFMEEQEGRDWSLYKTKNPHVVDRHQASRADKRDAYSRVGQTLLIEQRAYQGDATRKHPVTKERLHGEIMLVATWRGRRYLLYSSSSHREKGQEAFWRASYGGVGGSHFEKQPVENADDLTPELGRALDQAANRRKDLASQKDLYWTAAQLGVRSDAHGQPQRISAASPIAPDRSYVFPISPEAATSEGAERISKQIAWKLVKAKQRGELNRPFVELRTITERPDKNLSERLDTDITHADGDVPTAIYEDVHIGNLPLIEVIDNGVQAVGMLYRSNPKDYQGKIEIGFRILPEGGLEVIVTDNGVGIRRETLQRLFLEQGEQVSTKTEGLFRHGGHGEGVSQVYSRLVLSYGAEIIFDTWDGHEPWGGRLRLSPEMIHGYGKNFSLSPTAEPLQTSLQGTSVRFRIPLKSVRDNPPIEECNVDIQDLFMNRDWYQLRSIALHEREDLAKQAVTALQMLLAEPLDHVKPFDYYTISSAFNEMAAKRSELIRPSILEALEAFLNRNPREEAAGHLGSVITFWKSTLRLVENHESINKAKVAEVRGLLGEIEKGDDVIGMSGRYKDRHNEWSRWGLGWWVRYKTAPFGETQDIIKPAQATLGIATWIALVTSCGETLSYVNDLAMILATQPAVEAHRGSMFGYSMDNRRRKVVRGWFKATESQLWSIRRLFVRLLKIHMMVETHFGERIADGVTSWAHSSHNMRIDLKQSLISA